MAYGPKLLFTDVNLILNPGNNYGLVGANGAGKSTLLKILLSKLSSDAGSFEWGYETHISYFSQDHHDLLNEKINVFDWLSKQVDYELTSKIRTVLGQLLFRQDEAFKNILELSGGEGARLLLAKIVLEEGNVLVLDEPTNHLDIEAKDSLKKALKDYHGTVLMVTHDRDFAASIATRVIAVSERKIIDFKGTYEEYLSKYGKDYFKF